MIIPRRILLIGIVYCLAGLLAAWDIITGAFESRLSLNFMVLLLPVGYGLLRGKSRSRWWARFWLILGYGFCLLFAAVALIEPQKMSAYWIEHRVRGDDAVPWVLLSATALLFAFVFCHRMLYSDKANRFFETMDEENAAITG